MKIVDRDSFIAWTQGILLSRNAKGDCVVGDNVNNEIAEQELNEGKVVGLMDNNELISTIQLVDDEFLEKLI